MSNKPILLFVVSSVCGACVNFKRKMLPELEKELSNDPRLTYQIVEFEDMQFRKPINVTPHPDLKGFVKFFPTIMLVPANLWNDRSSKLKAVVKHGDEESPNIDYSKNSILSWINTSLKNPIFQNEVDRSNQSSRSHENGRYTIPTYGQFRHSKVDESDN
jgi:hypothetical protein